MDQVKFVETAFKNFTCSIREYFDSNVVLWNDHIPKADHIPS